MQLALVCSVDISLTEKPSDRNQKHSWGCGCSSVAESFSLCEALSSILSTENTHTQITVLWMCEQGFHHSSSTCTLILISVLSVLPFCEWCMCGRQILCEAQQNRVCQFKLIKECVLLGLWNSKGSQLNPGNKMRNK
jgi:hypothetical protein